MGKPGKACAYVGRIEEIKSGQHDSLPLFPGSDEDLARLVGEAETEAGVEKRSRLYTIDWIIWHVLQHEAAHVGQIELLRRLNSVNRES